jgi:hypothetical protein
MSPYQAFKRVAVPPQAAQQLQVTTLPAPTRGLIQNENETFMQPGGAIVCDNWMPTMRGVSLRGGCILHSDLHALDKNQARWDIAGWDRALWDHDTLPPGSTRKPVISAFEYAAGQDQKMFAANATRLVEVTEAITDAPPILVREGHASGNYVFSQLSNQGGDWGIAVNDAGDYPLRYDGTTWEILDHTLTTPPANLITGPVGSNVEFGKNLTYVCKYHERYFFIEASSMNAWYLPINAVGGALQMIPLSGAATKGGYLLFCAVWSVDAGDGLDDKLVFCTNLGELLIFSGSDPSTVANWRQEGRYSIPEPMGMNAHMPIGGDLLIMTVDGIVPVSASISKTPADLQMAMITRPIRIMWRAEVAAKKQWAWTMYNWPEQGGIFVSWPGSTPGYCAVVNAATGAWCRFVGYDATCFMRMRGDLYFGTQDGRIMQANRSGYDDGLPYTAVLVGGWEMFQSPSQTMVWRQARASFTAAAGQPFQPQLSAVTDYVVNLPPAPPAGPDPGVADVWDQGHWGPDKGGPPPPLPTPPERDQYAQWNQVAPRNPPVVRNTMWVSIGATGFSHAPVVQVTVAQQAKPNVDLISIGAVFERCGVNV